MNFGAVVEMAGVAAAGAASGKGRPPRGCWSRRLPDLSRPITTGASVRFPLVQFAWLRQQPGVLGPILLKRS